MTSVFARPPACNSTRTLLSIDALELVPYLGSLGISHVYASPLLTSRPGSTHGYDIVDHHAIDPELGGEAALRRLVASCARTEWGSSSISFRTTWVSAGLITRWWLDVLEWGRASPYAEYFDIDWEPPDATLRGKLLAPFLGNSYGEALDGGDLTLRFDPEDGRFFVSAYGSHRFPIDPRQYASVLREGDAFAGDRAVIRGDRFRLGRPRRDARARRGGARAALRRGRPRAAGRRSRRCCRAFAPDDPERPRPAASAA